MSSKGYADEGIEVNVKDLTELIIQLLKFLSKIGLIDTKLIYDSLDEENVYIIEYQKRYNYKELSKLLKRRIIFLPVNRTRAYKIRKSLEKILEEPVYKTRVYLGNKKGYLFYLEHHAPIVNTLT